MLFMPLDDAASYADAGMLSAAKMLALALAIDAAIRAALLRALRHADAAAARIYAV